MRAFPYQFSMPFRFGKIGLSTLGYLSLALFSCEQSPENTSAALKEKEDPHAEPVLHVKPGESIQAALEKAATDGVKKIIVRSGTYRPPSPRQALIWFNKRHDGILLEADGEVVLTAANPDVADPDSHDFPAIANHVVYFGHEVGPGTTIRGFKITGANDFVTARKGPDIQPDFPNQTSKPQQLSRSVFFYTDGGGIKIYANSAPTIENCEIFGNHSNPCGAGISIEQRGFYKVPVTIRNCIFRDNRVPLTGAAIDLLDLPPNLGSSALIENCLFINNFSNDPMKKRRFPQQTWSKDFGHGALTVFPPSRVTVTRCTLCWQSQRSGRPRLQQHLPRLYFLEQQRSGRMAHKTTLRTRYPSTQHRGFRLHDQGGSSGLKRKHRSPEKLLQPSRSRI